MQTLIFSKDTFSRAQAVAWAKRNGKKYDSVDETEDSYRLRQRDPGDFDKESFRTIDITKGVKAVVGHLKGARAAASAPRPAELAALFTGKDLAFSRAAFDGLMAGALAPSEQRMAANGAGGATADKPYQMTGGRAVIGISGPLLQHGGWYLDGHSAINARIQAAVRDPAVREIGLDIDSTGGIFAGNLDAVRSARAAITASGKPVTVWAGGDGAHSAAYAWATLADPGGISVSDTSGVGSIGVMRELHDYTEAAKKEGIKREVIRSGKRKAEGHPFVPNTDASRGRLQAHIDDMGEKFASLVALSRGISVDKVLDLEGESFYGQHAVDKGLADRVETRDEWLSRAAGTTSALGQGADTGDGMKGFKTALGDIASEEQAKAAIEGLIADKAKLEERLKALATATCTFVRQEALVAGRKTKAELDADAEADAALMADLPPDRIALHTLNKYASLARGAAVPKESEQGGGADIRPPGRRPEGELDGAKMSATEIARIKDPGVRRRLMDQFSAAQKPTDAKLFASVKTPFASE
jgi:ClpP class serine protease